MNPRQLRTFCKVAEINNFTKAAEVLYYTEAAVSQQVRALEKELGVMLFERSTRSVSLTPAGRRFYEYARRILDLHEEALQAVRNVPAELSGEVRIAASTIPGEHILPPLLAAFREQHPKVRLITIISDSEAVLGILRANQADIGIVGLKPTSARLDFCPWLKDTLVLVVHPKHRWARQKAAELDELKREPFIARERGSGTRVCLEQLLERQLTPITTPSSCRCPVPSVSPNRLCFTMCRSTPAIPTITFYTTATSIHTIAKASRCNGSFRWSASVRSASYRSISVICVRNRTYAVAFAL